MFLDIRWVYSVLSRDDVGEKAGLDMVGKYILVVKYLM